MAKVLLGVPSSGQISEASAQASWLPSLLHQVDRIPSCLSGPNFNACWVTAMNAGMRGHYCYFAMMHTDLGVVEETEGKRWVDILVEELEAHQAAFISVPMAIKDHRGLTSSGIGNPENRWNPWKRFTVRELETFPETFGIEDTDEPGRFLLHNHALCLFDLRWLGWYLPNRDGTARAVFNFTEKIELVEGVWARYQDSEDWAFSRCLWEMGARTVITRKIKTIHQGGMNYANWGEGGIWERDEDTRSQWGKQHVGGNALNVVP